MSNTGQIVRWTATSGSFLAGILLTGCASLLGPRHAAAPPPAPAATPTATPAPPPPPRPLVTPVNAFGEFGFPYAGQRGMGTELALQQHTASEEGYDADVAVDPTGKLLAFTSTRHSVRSNIYLQRVGGSAVVQLTSDPADDAHPAFSPDGRHVAFASNRAGSWDIYIMDVEGKNTRQVTSTPGQEMHPSFSPDGTRLVYCALSPRGEQWELWTVDLTTYERRMVGHGLFPAWSPDKNVDRIAFQRPRQRGSRLFSIWTMDLVQGEPRHLTEIAVSVNAAAVSAAWSPDGSRIAFATIVPDSERPLRDVWVVNADGTGRRRLTDGVGTNLSPSWGVDNRVYFVSDRGGHENIWSISAGAGSVDAVVGGRPDAQTPPATADVREAGH